MNRKEVLDSTVAFYGEDPANRRAIVGTEDSRGLGMCQYKTEDGRRCAVGRLVADDIIPQMLNSHGVIDVFKYLPPEVASLGVRFLEDLQALHDNRFNWAEKGGLSERGKLMYDRIVKDHCSSECTTELLIS